MRRSVSSSRSLIRTRHRKSFILCAALLGCFAIATPSSVAALIGSTACNNGGNCSVTGTQPYFINGFQINLSWTMSCASITVAGH